MATHSRDSTGRYIVRFPICHNPVELGNTHEVALKRVLSLETRLTRLGLLQQYYDCLKEYVELGHIRSASQFEPYIITHHVVLKESSTTSLRVVFNASQKDSHGNSLNDNLHIGPKIQKDIEDIVSNFRIHRIAMTCDIKMMFRMIRVHNDDIKYLHLLFRLSSSDPITEWEICVLSFGITTRPFLSQRALLQLISDEGDKYPLAAEALRSSTYVDDIVHGSNTEEGAIQLYIQLTQLLKLGGFVARKFTTNCPKVLQFIPADLRESTFSFDIPNEGSPVCTKILGLRYNHRQDTFCYLIPDSTLVYNKRAALSVIARIFDVNGYLCPVIAWAKIFMQRLWILAIGWDEEFGVELQEEWSSFMKDLPSLSSIEIPRHILANAIGPPQVVGMCDASIMAYAAVLYLRVPISETTYECRLLKAKSRVAPLKVQSIPRLELCAAHMLAQLLNSMEHFLLKISTTTVTLFTDSSIVLAWLHTPPYKLKTFVANRVVDILELTNPHTWRHISSKDNSADIASRSVLPTHLIHNALWWHGPEFLSSSNTFSDYSSTSTMVADLPDIKQVNHALISPVHYNNPLLTTIEKFSSFLKLQRVVAYVLRFIHNSRHSSSRRSGSLLPFEYNEAILQCVRITQTTYFPNEIRQIQQDRETSKYLSRLTPFLHGGLLRAGGRLKNSHLPFSSKHPLLLPKNCHLSNLICDFYHSISLHGGILLTQSLIRRRFWICSVRSLLFKRIGKCHICYKVNAPTLQPVMADLPSARFSQVRAFLNVGVDFAGPFSIKEHSRRNARSVKGYVCLFVCLSVKAVHIELVSSLSSAAFLEALDRFTSRRGLPQNIYSDNGTNFVGAAREMKEIYAVLQQSEDAIKDHLHSQLTTWHFNPPQAPSFGGIWEAAIKSCKYHLKQLIGNHSLTLEEFSTLLTRIEASLNSRPLCPLSADVNDLQVLTPGHFLVGTSLLNRPELDLPSPEVTLLDRWRFISQALQAFWKSWSKDYLHTLMGRPKWTSRAPPLNVGDVVLIPATVSPGQWNIGRVSEIFPGSDDVVRTAQGTLKRPANKLIRLPPQ